MLSPPVLGIAWPGIIDLQLCQVKKKKKKKGNNNISWPCVCELYSCVYIYVCVYI